MTGKLHSAPHTRDDVGPTPEDGAPVILHPLVVLNVSDHFTRYAALQSYPRPPPQDGSASGAGASSAGPSDRGTAPASGGVSVTSDGASGASAADDGLSAQQRLQLSHRQHHPGGSSGSGGGGGAQPAQQQQQHQEGEQQAGQGDTPMDAAGNPRVVGILLGVTRGRVVEVCHSFELPAKVGPVGITVDEDFMRTRLEQYRQIFAQYNVVGWYCTGVELGDDEHRLHSEVFSKLTEAPILLFLNPAACVSVRGAAGGSKDGGGAAGAGMLKNDLIVTLQLETKVVDDAPRAVLQTVAHRYASEDSERIAVDHVMRHAVPGGADGTSSTSLHLGTLRRSVSMLRARLGVVMAFLEATVSGKIEVDHALLRQVSGVCARLPALDCDEFAKAFADEKSDSNVVTYLSGVTKSLCSLSDAVDMFGRINSRGGGGASGTARRRNPFMRV